MLSPFIIPYSPPPAQCYSVSRPAWLPLPCSVLGQRAACLSRLYSADEGAGGQAIRILPLCSSQGFTHPGSPPCPACPARRHILFLRDDRCVTKAERITPELPVVIPMGLLSVHRTRVHSVGAESDTGESFCAHHTPLAQLTHGLRMCELCLIVSLPGRKKWGRTECQSSYSITFC